jgi:hypothetical protein
MYLLATLSVCRAPLYSYGVLDRQTQTPSDQLDLHGCLGMVRKGRDFGVFMDATGHDSNMFSGDY